MFAPESQAIMNVILLLTVAVYAALLIEVPHVTGAEQQDAVADTNGLIRVPLYSLPSTGGVATTTNSTALRRLLPSTPEHDYGTTHFVQVRLGYPGQYRTLAVSTSSDYTAFPCTGCVDCGDDEKQYFRYGASKTFESVPCGKCFNRERKCDHKRSNCVVSEVDQDLSEWEGFEAMDMAYIGSSEDKKNGFPLMFSCQTKANGRFKNKEVAGGIISMSPSKTSFINQMYRARVLPVAAFSLCFGHKILGEQSADGSSKGAMTLGGYDPKYHTSPIVFASNTRQNNASFTLYLSKMYLRVGGGQQVNPDMDNLKVITVDFDPKVVNDGGVMLDSGTPFTVLDSQLQEPFMRAWKSATGEDFSNKKYQLTRVQLFLLPTILLQFRPFPGEDVRHINPDNVPNLVGSGLDPTAPNDVLIAFPASHYMEHNAHTDRYRPRISFAPTTGDARSHRKAVSILGANMMQGHDITFDVANNRIGFAESASCVNLPQAKLNVLSEGNGDGNSANHAVLTLDDDVLEEEAAKLPNRNFLDDTFDDDHYAHLFLSEREKGGNKFVTGVGALDPDGPAACNTITCKSFVGLGYVFVFMGGWVAYKCATMKGSDIAEFAGDETEVQRLQEIDFPDYEPEDGTY